MPCASCAASSLRALAISAEVALPDVVHPEQVGFLGFRRCGVEHVGFGGGLVFADLEQVHVDAELVLQALAVVLAVAAEAFEQQPAHRVEVDLVGLRGQQVLLLVHHLGERDDLLAARLDARDRRSDLAHRRHAAGLQLVQAQHHAVDALVVAGRVERAQQVAQLHFAGLVRRTPC